MSDNGKDGILDYLKRFLVVPLKQVGATAKSDWTKLTRHRWVVWTLVAVGVFAAANNPTRQEFIDREMDFFYSEECENPGVPFTSLNACLLNASSEAILYELSISRGATRTNFVLFSLHHLEGSYGEKELSLGMFGGFVQISYSAPSEVLD